MDKEIVLLDSSRELAGFSGADSFPGFRVARVENRENAWKMLADREPGLLVLDPAAEGGEEGWEFLEEVKRRFPFLPVVACARSPAVEVVVRALRAGAADFIEKPVAAAALAGICTRFLRSPGEGLGRSWQGVGDVGDGLLSRSPAMAGVLRLVRELKGSRRAVLIRGESGTGKELVARALGRGDLTRGRPFVVQNCAALTCTLADSELFGHVKGAFTGALERKPGLFELAEGGTLFLDEVGDLPAEVQSKILRVLQDGEVRPVGGRQVLRPEVRLIYATNRDLEGMVAAGIFREDLYYRLQNALPVLLPPLRERSEDIPLLAEYFLEKYRRGPKKRLGCEAIEVLVAHDWPGNVRGLEGMMANLAQLAAGEEIGAEDLPAPLSGKRPRPRGRPAAIDLSGHLRTVERERILDALRGAGTVKEAARLLGLHRSTLYSRMQLLGIVSGREFGCRGVPGAGIRRTAG